MRGAACFLVLVVLAVYLESECTVNANPLPDICLYGRKHRDRAETASSSEKPKVVNKSAEVKQTVQQFSKLLEEFFLGVSSEPKKPEKKPKERKAEKKESGPMDVFTRLWSMYLECLTMLIKY